MRILCSLLFFVLISTSYAQVDPDKALADLQQLVGEWRTETDKKGKYTTKIWLKDSVGFAGTGMEIKKEKTIGEESLRIFIREGTLYYSANVRSQNKEAWIDFAMTEHTENTWMFENPVHDFPRKIRYTLKDENSLIVNVSGRDGGFDLEFQKK